LKASSFASILMIVGLVAAIYSPSVLGLGTGPGLGTTSPTNTGPVGASKFLSYLRGEGYNVVIANDSQTELNLLSSGKNLLLLIGADDPVSQSELLAISNDYKAGTLSMLIAEGNSTNGALINTALQVSVSGSAIVDPSSTFQDQRVLLVTLGLGTQTRGILDIASPIDLGNSTMTAVARTSPTSYDGQDPTRGSRTVVGVETSAGGGRALLLTDSAPFLNYLFGNTSLTADERTFVSSMVSWTTNSNTSVRIIYDNFHYAVFRPKPGFGLPLGPIIAWGVELGLQQANSFTPSTTSSVGSFFGVGGPLLNLGLILLTLLGVYFGISRTLSPEKAGKDDQPSPSIERPIVAESKARLDFLNTSRKRSFYVASLARLYEVLDDVVLREFGTPLESLDPGSLSTRLSEPKALEAQRLFTQLKGIYGYAKGTRRFMFPPILRWKSKAASMTKLAESFLNELGLTIDAAESKKPVEGTIAGR